ncbi:MAG TPA: TraB/GumN family protein [Xanthobacteraceae bacterium]|nr:TraB/GumN family protein [Xanthobacteraceae bacterium]
MRRASVLAFVSAALLAPAIASAAPEKAAPPASAGHDIFTEMKISEPDGYTRIRRAADAVPNTGALLWRIERKGVPTSYLFGTIHSTDERVTTLSPAVTAAFNASRTVALEIVERPAESGEPPLKALLAANGFYAGGNGLKDVLTSVEMTALGRTLAAEGIPQNATHLLRPWFAALALAIPVCEKQRAATGLLPLDKRLERDGKAQGKQVVGLETMEFQFNAIMGLPEDVQVSFLKATVATLGQRDDALEVLHQAYLRRDLAIAMPFTKRIIERAGYDSAAIDVIERDIAIKRNYGMREAARPLLRQGSAFIAVGALHLLGKEGLVALLRADGYSVTPVD